MAPDDGRNGGNEGSDVASAEHDVEDAVEQVKDAAERVEHAVEGAQQTAESVQRLAQGGSVQDIARNAGGVAGGAGSVLSAVTGGSSDASSTVSNAASSLAGATEQRGLANSVISAASTVQSVARVVEAAADVAETLFGGGAQLPVVHYAFSSDGDKSTTWRVYKARFSEGLSDLYDASLELANEDLGADPDKLLGQSCEFTAARGDDSTRRLCGIVHRVEHLGTRAGHQMCRVRIAPALAALAQRTNSRVFQELGADEIISKVLKEGLDPFDRKFRLDLARPPLKREYCVQYQETDLAFVRRLLEDEGITFFFDHSTPKEEMVMVSANSAFPKVTTMDGNPIAIAGAEQETASVETVRSFDMANSLQSTSVVARDFDWTQPLLDLTRETRGKDGQQRDREVFLYPADPTIGGYDDGAHRYTREDSQTVARIERERIKLQEKVATGQGNVTGFTPGYTFEVSGHGRAALDGEYLLTRVEHEGEAAEQITADSHDDERRRNRYTNRFECIPSGVPFRPAKVTPREMVHGIQTATVVGPSSEEIYTDFHGRIKVQFHWDREGKRDEKSSCWVRVAQTWGGAGWGFVFIPRIGMEVIVNFLEGDPDKPLVVGCVYNGTHNTPYELDGAKTKSTIRTQSSPGNDPSKFNELRFEDAAGSEEVFLHAQKDFNEVVLHDHTTTVGNDQTNTVGANQTESVGANQSMTVTGNRTKSIKKNEDVAISQNRTVKIGGYEETKIEGTRTETVTGLETITLQAGRTETVNTFDKLNLTGLRNVTVSQTDDLSVTGVQTIKIGADASLTVTGKYGLNANTSSLTFESGKVGLSAAADITVVNKSGDIGIDASAGKLGISAANEVVISCGKASISLKSDGTVSVSGSQSVGLGSGSTAVKLEPAGLTSSGPKVTTSAVGIHQISGALIKIN